MINSRGKLSPEDYLFLYWYAVLIENVKVQYDDFQVSESLIDRYNNYLTQWNQEYNSNPEHFVKAIDWDKSRTKTDYFIGKLQKGQEFETWVENEFKKYGVELGFYHDETGQFSGENAYGIEIKHDMMLCKTGNVYIEYQERLKSNKPWVNSGILKQDNSQYWLIGDMRQYVIIKKIDLINIYKRLLNGNIITGCKFVSEKENGTSKGFIIPFDLALRISFAKSIEEFMRKKDGSVSTETAHIIYAINYYYHGKRNCKYIVNKKDNDLLIFNSFVEAEKNGFKACTDPECFK